MKGRMMQRGMMHYSSFLMVALTAAAVMMAGPALASDPSLGAIMNNTRGSLRDVPDIFNLIAYIAGLFLAVSSILKIKDHVNGGPGAPALSDGIKRFLAGGMFLSAPFMAETVYNSTFGPGDKIDITSRTGANVTGNGLDALVVRFMSDVGGPIEKLLVVFCYLAGIAFLLVGISRLTKRAEDGPRGPAGMGTIMTFLTAGALFAFGDMMGVFTASLFGDSTISTRVTLTDTMGLNSDDKQRVQTVIEAVMAFVMIVGFIAFIRGWFVLRNFAEGQQGATMAQGLTFLFGGALAINLGELVNALQNTMGITGLAFS